ncbi:DUF349 domain-containing protein [Roseivirga sp. E12]|uniref:DUF349 domain-containing protein n=1 Tax=Roseivirga sp. E12 TaxID=2819237 RepID=UPI001ABC576D|nr:DUF349 domain-containing protein [Roseivirga sp. E12]MBO3700349.1 DUF349 domain-containing protein [Roseivirga sp. E12]
MEKKDYGYVLDGKVYRKAFMEFPDLELGEVKETEEQSLIHYYERFEIAVKKVSEVKEKIAANTNKGSFLIQVERLIDTLHGFDAIGDFESLYVTLHGLQTELIEYVEANRQKNLEIKIALLDQLKEVAESHDWKASSTTVKEIQGKWLKTGAVAQERREEIEGAFEGLVQKFYERRSAFYADLEKMSEEKEAAFEEFLIKAEKLKAEKDIVSLRKSINSFKEEWQALGKIKPSKHNEFWQKFQEIIKSALNAAKKLEKKKAKLSTKDNQKLKEEILSELKKANETLIPKIDLNLINKKWKGVGNTDKDVSKELSSRYLKLSGMISEKKFLNSLVEKKSKKGTSESDLNKLRVRLLRGLLDRDYNELKTFEENLGKFNMASGLDNLLDRKLAQQKLKVEIKKEILAELKKLS